MVCDKCGGKMRKVDDNTMECSNCGNIMEMNEETVAPEENPGSETKKNGI